jgi:hypothetical protein
MEDGGSGSRTMAAGENVLIQNWSRDDGSPVIPLLHVGGRLATGNGNLGQPANHPTQMVESLSAFFAKRSQVKAAYLALMHDASR